MATNPPPDLVLSPVRGEPHQVSDWLVMFHMLMVAVDPFDERSAWLVETGGRVLSQYEQADCRVAWLVGGTAEEAQLFLGPWEKGIMTFADPELVAVQALGLSALPAIVLLALDGSVVDAVEGWDPPRWRELTSDLSRVLRWSRPSIPAPGDPAPFEGTPVAVRAGEPAEGAPAEGAPAEGAPSEGAPSQGAPAG